MGRVWFSESPDAIMEEINVSIDVDRHLYAQDIAASKAHAAMLAAQGILTAGDAKNMAKGLDTILLEITAGKFAFQARFEDIHMNVESRLTPRLSAPPPGGCTPRGRATTRSRPISGFMSAMCWTTSTQAWRRTSTRWRRGRWSTPIP